MAFSISLSSLLGVASVTLSALHFLACFSLAHYHRILRLGHGHRRAVLILWAWTALLSGFVLWPTYTGEGNSIVPAGIAAVCLILFTVLHPRLRSDKDVPV
mgnify:CR=1 FL=1